MAKFNFLSWLLSLHKTLPHPSTYAHSLQGKTVIVTGANAGLGFEAAKHIARFNPGRLILACRNLAAGNEAAGKIKEETGCENVGCWELDLAKFSSVRAFADRYEREGGLSLDLLIQNAGVNVHGPYKTTPDGWETQLQVNHLAPSLLGFLLLPYLMKARPDPPTPRVTWVASEMHFYVQLREVEGSLLRALSGEEGFDDAVKMVYSWYPKKEARYPVTKLLNILHCRALAAHLPPPPSCTLTTNSVNPSACHSTLQRDLDHLMLVRLAQRWFFRTAEMGSRTIVHAALSPEAGQMGETGKEAEVGRRGRGGYWNDCREAEVGDWVLGEEGKRVQERIWRETIDVLSEVDPRVKDIVKEYLV